MTARADAPGQENELVGGTPVRPRTAHSPESSATKAGRSIAATLLSRSEAYFLLFAWIAEVTLFSILKPAEYFTLANFQTIFSSQATTLIVALAFLPPIIAGSLDLSPPGVLSITTVLLGVSNINWGWPIELSIVLALVVGLAVGCVNALVIVRFHVDGIIVTLGMSTFLLGIGLGINNIPIAGLDESFTDVIRYRIFDLQVIFYIALFLCIVMWFVLSRTPTGRRLFFVGAGPEVARLSGIPVSRYRACSYIAGSMLAAIAGITLTGLLGSADGTVGGTLLLPGLAAVFLGATAITPRRPNVWGTFIAVYFLTFGITGLQTLGLDAWINQVFYGASLIVAVTVASILGLRARSGQ